MTIKKLYEYPTVKTVGNTMIEKLKPWAMQWIPDNKKCKPILDCICRV